MVNPERLTLHFGLPSEPSAEAIEAAAEAYESAPEGMRWDLSPKRLQTALRAAYAIDGGSIQPARQAGSNQSLPVTSDDSATARLLAGSTPAIDGARPQEGEK